MKSAIGAVRSAELTFQRFFAPHAPALQLQVAGLGWDLPRESSWLDNDNDSSNAEERTLKPGGFGDIFGQSVWQMAVPKSKVSKSRKRMKHKQHIPDAIGWSRCVKCGEPKRPHRICTSNIEVCAMRPEEYEEYLGTGSGTPAAAPATKVE